mmetsp:Transcript_72812/g.138311  ORF Transcript_72812/g.138311 Transcript_72812/m.138311 type:complete len:83 (+) Transcript_72812:250-498(+)
MLADMGFEVLYCIAPSLYDCTAPICFCIALHPSVFVLHSAHGVKKLFFRRKLIELNQKSAVQLSYQSPVSARYMSHLESGRN